MKTSKILPYNSYYANLKSCKRCVVKKNFNFSFNALNKDTFISTGLIKKNDDIFQVFNNISNSIFSDSKKDLNSFKNLLYDGKIALSSSIIRNYKNPSSAVGIKLNKNDSVSKNISSLIDKVMQGKGVGINFSEFDNPNALIQKINSYFKYKEKSSPRPPAGIALLNINHPKILDFITLKSDEDYSNWCFDLSVVLPKDFLKKVDNNEAIVLQDGKKIQARDIYDTLLNSMLKKGEPGVIFSDNKDYICDSCGACELKEKEKLTISHINLSEFFNNKKNKPDYKGIKKASNILSKAMSKIDSNSRIGVVGYQELLDKLNINYGSNDSIKILKNCLRIIQSEAHKFGLKTAISPTGSVSRYLNVTPSIQPKDYSNITYLEQINTLIAAQKYIDGNISNTIILNNNNSTDDIDKIFRCASSGGLKGFTVFKN